MDSLLFIDKANLKIYDILHGKIKLNNLTFIFLLNNKK
jgi:hypothetical protein